MMLVSILLLSVACSSAYVVPSNPLNRIQAFAREQLVKVGWQMIQNLGEVKPLELGVDVEIRESYGRGRGVFALRQISPGEVVGIYEGQQLCDADYAFAVTKGITSGNYGFGVGDGWVCDGEDPELSSWLRFINHSVRRLNCDSGTLKAFGMSLGILVEVISPIQPGQELFVDYGRDYWDDAVGPIGLQRFLIDFA